MKKNFLYLPVIVVAVVLGASAVYAQTRAADQVEGQRNQGQGAQMTTEQRLERMTKRLHLSDTQQQQIKPILENEGKQIQAMRQDSALSHDDRMNKMLQIRQETSNQIKPILSADQQQEYEQMMSHQSHYQSGKGQN